MTLSAAEQKIFTAPAAVNAALALRVIELSRAAITQRGSFHIALAGGSTPQSFYSCLASDEYASRLDWQHIHIYFGDERHVPPHHKDSNFRMAAEALLKRVPLPSPHIHRIHTEMGDPQQCAASYADELQRSVPLSNGGVPVFDLVLLGLGPDGHIASLFPDSDILQQRNTLVDAVYVEKMDSWRVSLTYPAIENARQIILLVTGANKADIVRDVLRPPQQQHKPYPVQMLQADNMAWYLDNAAARYITDTGSDADTGC